MILVKKYKKVKINSSNKINDKLNYAIFLKNISLTNIHIRLSINASKKILIVKNKFLLAWSNRSNDKAYNDRRRIFRRNPCSSY
jgi:hypothetical protein